MSRFLLLGLDSASPPDDDGADWVLSLGRIAATAAVVVTLVPMFLGDAGAGPSVIDEGEPAPVVQVVPWPAQKFPSGWEWDQQEIVPQPAVGLDEGEWIPGPPKLGPPPPQAFTDDDTIQRVQAEEDAWTVWVPGSVARVPQAITDDEVRASPQVDDDPWTVPLPWVVQRPPSVVASDDDLPIVTVTLAVDEDVWFAPPPIVPRVPTRAIEADEDTWVPQPPPLQIDDEAPLLQLGSVVTESLIPAPWAGGTDEAGFVVLDDEAWTFPPIDGGVWNVMAPWWDDQQTTVQTSNQPDEDAWLPPIPPAWKVPVPSPNWDDQIPAGSLLFGLADEDLWQVTSPGWPWANWVPSPAWDDQVPGTLLVGGKDEDLWQVNRAWDVPRVPRPFDDDQVIVLQPAPLTFDEPLWIVPRPVWPVFTIPSPNWDDQTYGNLKLGPEDDGFVRPIVRSVETPRHIVEVWKYEEDPFLVCETPIVWTDATVTTPSIWTATTPSGSWSQVTPAASWIAYETLIATCGSDWRAIAPYSWAQLAPYTWAQLDSCYEITTEAGVSYELCVSGPSTEHGVDWVPPQHFTWLQLQAYTWPQLSEGALVT